MYQSGYFFTKLTLFLSLALLSSTSIFASNQTHYEWAVIGAGPAGITAIDKLISQGVPHASIAWIDPEFTVGGLKQYQDVPANLSAKQWASIMDRCEHIKKCPTNPVQYLKNHDPETFYPLSIIVKPLQEVTHWLLGQVHGFQEKVINLQPYHNAWNITTNHGTLQAHKVILATGCHPRSLNYPCQEIPLISALNKAELAQKVNAHDTIAVVGSAHSAVSTLMFLSQMPVKRIINFYNKPFEYTVQTPQGVMNAETGLKGPAAQFAKNFLDTNAIQNITRVYNTEESRNQWLPQCTKIIYAAGFEQNSLPWNNGKPLHYDDTTGIIAPHLFGFGIAFPEKRADAQGKIEHRVGMPHFIDYGNRVIPQWIQMA